MGVQARHPEHGPDVPDLVHVADLADLVEPLGVVYLYSLM